MKTDHVKTIVNESSSKKWTPLSALKYGEYLSCIDGRHTSCVIATPGGDLGLFVAMLTAIEQQIGSLTYDVVKLWLETIVEWHPRFYMHTDEGSLRALLARLGSNAKDHGMSEVEFIRRPPPQFREPLKKLLYDAQFHGCGFVKSMLIDPAKYGVRKPAVQFAVGAFFDQLWSGSPSAYLEVLQGDHDEEAVLHVDTRDASIEQSPFIPALKGLDDGPSRLFLNHRTARRFVAHHNLRLLARAGLLPIAVDMDIAESYIDQLCDKQLMTVIGALAPHLPQFDVTFDHMGDNPEISPR